MHCDRQIFEMSVFFPLLTFTIYCLSVIFLMLTLASKSVMNDSVHQMKYEKIKPNKNIPRVEKIEKKNIVQQQNV